METFPEAKAASEWARALVFAASYGLTFYLAHGHCFREPRTGRLFYFPIFRTAVAYVMAADCEHDAEASIAK